MMTLLSQNIHVKVLKGTKFSSIMINIYLFIVNKMQSQS